MLGEPAPLVEGMDAKVGCGEGLTSEASNTPAAATIADKEKELTTQNSGLHESTPISPRSRLLLGNPTPALASEDPKTHVLKEVAGEANEALHTLPEQAAKSSETDEAVSAKPALTPAHPRPEGSTEFAAAAPAPAGDSLSPERQSAAVSPGRASKRTSKPPMRLQASGISKVAVESSPLLGFSESPTRTAATLASCCSQPFAACDKLTLAGARQVRRPGEPCRSWI